MCIFACLYVYIFPSGVMTRCGWTGVPVHIHIIIVTPDRILSVVHVPLEGFHVVTYTQLHAQCTCTYVQCVCIYSVYIYLLSLIHI